MSPAFRCIERGTITIHSTTATLSLARKAHGSQNTFAGRKFWYQVWQGKHKRRENRSKWWCELFQCSPGTTGTGGNKAEWEIQKKGGNLETHRMIDKRIEQASKVFTVAKRCHFRRQLGSYFCVTTSIRLHLVAIRADRHGRCCRCSFWEAAIPTWTITSTQMSTFGDLSKEPEYCLDIGLESVFLAQNREACWSRQSMEPAITELLLSKQLPLLGPFYI